MAVRQFDGVDDQIVLSGGTIGALGNGAHSMVALVYILVLATDTQGFIVSAQVGTTNVPAALYARDDANVDKVAYGSDPGDAYANAVNPTLNAWNLIAFTKASGTTTVRMHRAALGSGWSRANSTQTIANHTGTVNRVEIGSVVNSTYGNFRIAVAGVWARELSDAEIDSITDATADFENVSGGGPEELWEFNQASTATAVTSLTGTANQTALTGTSTDSSADPTWTYGLGEPAFVAGGGRAARPGRERGRFPLRSAKWF